MDIKIFIVCHEQYKAFHNEIFKPIQVGTAIRKAHFEKFLYDDEGENISAKNPHYCELTAIYWAWKNVDADYYGFMHYRRYFSFSNIIKRPYIDYETLDDKFLHEHGYMNKSLEKILQSCDVVAPVGEKMKETVYEQYKHSKNHHIEDLDFALNYIEQHYPDFQKAATQYIYGKVHYFCNMFVMKKSLFRDYCTWLFPILEAQECHIVSEKNNLEENRVSGFLAERLFGIYYTYLKNQNIRVIELPRVHFQNVDIQQSIEKMNDDREIIPIAFATNKRFLPYLAVTIQSLVQHSSNTYHYHLIILHSDRLDDYSVNKLYYMVHQKNNIKIDFYDVKDFLNSKNFFVDKHLSVETYFRLFLPDIVPFYDKLVYLDSDLILECDIAELYQTDLQENLLAACQDIDFIGCWKSNSERRKYVRDILQLHDGLEYFQAGVLLMNLKEFRKQYSVEKMVAVALSRKWEFHDQDVLNYICRGKVVFLEQKWNVVTNWKASLNERMDILKQSPIVLFDEYLKARKEPYIIHYAGYQKPWNIIKYDRDYVFWQYAKQTPFYEQILYEWINLSKKTNIVKKIKRFVFTKERLNKIVPPGTRRRALVKKIKNKLKINI